MQNIGTVYDFESFSDIVICNQDTDSTRFDISHKGADVVHLDRINARKRLIK